MSYNIKETVAKLKQISEGHLGTMADRVELDHEVQLARGQLYKIAKYAIKLHEAFKDVNEVQGLDGWVSAKITEAALAMDDVAHFMEYELSPANVANEGIEHKRLQEEEGTAADLLHEYNVLKEVEQVDFNLANLAPELRPVIRKAMIKFPDAVDPLSAVVRMLQQEVERQKGTNKEMGRLDNVNDVQDVDIDSTDIYLSNLVARVGDLEQSHEVDEDSEHNDSDEEIEPGYTKSERDSMTDLIKRLNLDDKMNKDPFGSDFTRGDPESEFSKRVADQNRKAMGTDNETTTETKHDDVELSRQLAQVQDKHGLDSDWREPHTGENVLAPDIAAARKQAAISAAQKITDVDPDFSMMGGTGLENLPKSPKLPIGSTGTIPGGQGVGRGGGRTGPSRPISNSKYSDWGK